MGNSFFFIPPIIALILLTPAGAKAGEAISDSGAYARCIAEARRAPTDGLETASAWAALDGGAAAGHCQAIALLGLKRYVRAAERLERLAREINSGARIKAQILGQAGQAWLLAGRPRRAQGVFGAALGLAPDDVQLMIDRAQAWAALGDFAKAIEDLDRAHELAPLNADVLVFRASAKRQLKQLEPAAADLHRALIMVPSHPKGLLERGMLKRLKGDKAGARRDWLAAIEAAPGGGAAGTARTNLEIMDGPK